MSNNAYAYTNHIEVEPKHSGLIIKHKDTPVKCQAVRHAPTGRGGLSFTSHALFRTIEDIAAWPGPSVPCSTDAPVSTLTIMVAELESFGMCSYWRFKAWVNYHRDTVREVSKSKEGKYNNEERVGVAWLTAEECPFFVLARCYFEIASRERERERKDRRKAMLIAN